MYIKKIASISLIFFVPFVVASQGPGRLTLLLSQTLTALETRKKILQQKISTFEDKRDKGRLIVHPWQQAEIAQASQLTRDVLQKSIARLNQRIDTIKKDQATLSKRGIKDVAHEDDLIKKIQLQQRVADIEDQLDQARNTERFISSQSSQNPQNQAARTLTTQWTGQLDQLQTKLQRARSDLSGITVQL
jgi:hypothetical protein